MNREENMVLDENGKELCFDIARIIKHLPF
jgi:hypothetical protein